MAAAALGDFDDWLRFHLDKADKRAAEAAGGLDRKAAARGMYGSSALVVERFEAGHREFDVGVDTALAELKRAKRVTDLDHGELRRVTGERLEEFAQQMRATLGVEKWFNSSSMKPLAERYDTFGTKLAFALRQFDVGLLDPAEPSTPLSMTNSIAIETMVGGVLQQGTSHSTQNVQMGDVNLDDAKVAVSELQKALTSLPAQVADELRPDIDTIAAQLAKPKPSLQIVREAGTTLRNLSEGVIAGALTPVFVSALASVLRALGLN